MLIGEAKTTQQMYLLVAQALFNGAGIKATGDANKDQSDKLVAYSLCTRLIDGKGVMEATPEEVVLMKRSINTLSPGAFAQIANLLNG